MIELPRTRFYHIGRLATSCRNSEGAMSYVSGNSSKTSVATTLVSHDLQKRISTNTLEKALSTDGHKSTGIRRRYRATILKCRRILVTPIRARLHRRTPLPGESFSVPASPGQFPEKLPTTPAAHVVEKHEFHDNHVESVATDGGTPGRWHQCRVRVLEFLQALWTAMRRLLRLRQRHPTPNVPVTVDNLSAKTIQEIFEFFHSSSSHPRRNALMLASVSQRWRELALATRLLWSTLQIWHARSVGWLSPFLQRSGRHPLHIHVAMGGTDTVELYQTHLDAIMPYMHRWKSFRFELPAKFIPGFMQVLNLLRSEAPLLEELLIEGHGVSPNKDSAIIHTLPGPSVFPFGCPTLRRLAVTHVDLRVCFPPITATITSLDIDIRYTPRITMAVFRALICSLPKLKKLGLTGNLIDFTADDSRMPLTVLPALESLTFALVESDIYPPDPYQTPNKFLYSFFKYTSLSRLRHIKLCHIKHDHRQFVRVASECFRSRKKPMLPALEHLEVDTTVDTHWDADPDFFKSCPAVTRFDFKRGNFGHAPAFMRVLGGGSLTDTALWPRLTCMTALYLCSRDDYEALRGFVQYRKEIDKPLLKLTVWFGVDGERLPWLRKNVAEVVREWSWTSWKSPDTYP